MPHDTTRETDSPDISTLIHQLMLEAPEPARLIELYYWSTQPSLLPVIRRFAALAPPTRTVIEAYLRLQNPQRVTATVDASGNVTLMAEPADTLRAPVAEPRRRRVRAAA